MMLENFSMAIKLGFPLPVVPQSNSCRFGPFHACLVQAREVQDRIQRFIRGGSKGSTNTQAVIRCTL